MDFYLPTKQECDAICDKTEAFYCADRVIEGQNVAIYDYRLASISDFVDNKAFELRGLCFVEQSDGTWQRNLLMNKFFNVNQTTMDDLYKIYFTDDTTLILEESKTLMVSGRPSKTATILVPKLKENDFLIKHGKTVKQVQLHETRGWMYEDVKDKKITNVANKEDGSIISFIKFANGKVRAKSKMSFESEQAVMAQGVYDADENLREYVNQVMIDEEFAIFELVSPENQIVLEYQNTDLVLLQVRAEDGSYYTDSKEIAIANDISYAESFPESMKNLDDLLTRKEIDTSNIEGWIITFEDGQMAKIKTDKYLSLHGLIGPDAFRENLLIKTILDGNIDDVIAALVPGEKKNKIIVMSEKVEHHFNHMVVEFKELRRKYFQDFGEVRKDFAIKHSKDELFGIVMKTLKTSFRDVEQTAEKAVKEHIERNTNSLGKAKEWVGKI